MVGCGDVGVVDVEIAVGVGTLGRVALLSLLLLCGAQGKMLLNCWMACICVFPREW